VQDDLRPLSHVLLFGKVFAFNELKAPAAMYLAVWVFPSSMTSGASFAASAASNFCSTVSQVWYWMLMLTPGCCCWNWAFAAAIAPGHPFCASVITQTVTDCAVARLMLPVAVEATVASAAASATAAMMRNFIAAPS